MATQIRPFTKTPSRSKPSTFSEDMDSRLSEENSRIEEMNLQSDENNILASQVATNASQVANDKNDVANMKNEAASSAASALASKNAIQSYVIPTEATYSYSEIDNLIVNKDAYRLGKPGEIGFGVATCPTELIPDGWLGLPGHDDILSQNYGNYLDTNGSVLVYIPKHWYKFTGNDLEISDTPVDGFVLDRSFINAGVETNGIFVYKYGASNLNGKFCSVKNGLPLSTHLDHNPISGLNGTPVNNYGGLYTAVKTAGANYFLTSIFNYTMLARLALAHGKAATSTAACAFIDVNPKLPKGCLANVLRDVNDSSVTFTSDGYSSCAKTGSGTPFAKTTHNGQECGIADLNGNMWEVGSGFIRYDVDGFLALKESVDIRSIVNDSTVQASGGAYDKDLYDVVDLSDHNMSTAGAWTYLGNGTEQVFSMNIDRASNDYKRTSIGIPNALGVSASGTTEFGNDGIYKYTRNEMACVCGGNWGSSSNAGVFAMLLSSSRSYSSYSVGGRASYLV
jgi:hypothetical protein